MVRADRYIAPDGTPEYVIHAEQWLVGGALLASHDAVPALSPDDFHDDTLARIWNAISELASSERDPSIPAVARLLNEWGQLDQVGAEARLAVLAGDRFAFLYAGKPTMDAHAALVAEWGEKRRTIARLSDEIRATSSGKVIPSAHRFRGGVAFVTDEGAL